MRRRRHCRHLSLTELGCPPGPADTRGRAREAGACRAKRLVGSIGPLVQRGARWGWPGGSRRAVGAQVEKRALVLSRPGEQPHLGRSQRVRQRAADRRRHVPLLPLLGRVVKSAHPRVVPEGTSHDRAQRVEAAGGAGRGKRVRRRSGGPLEREAHGPLPLSARAELALDLRRGVRQRRLLRCAACTPAGRPRARDWPSARAGAATGERGLLQLHEPRLELLDLLEVRHTRLETLERVSSRAPAARAPAARSSGPRIGVCRVRARVRPARPPFPSPLAAARLAHLRLGRGLHCWRRRRRRLRRAGEGCSGRVRRRGPLLGGPLPASHRLGETSDLRLERLYRRDRRCRLLGGSPVQRLGELLHLGLERRQRRCHRRLARGLSGGLEPLPLQRRPLRRRHRSMWLLQLRGARLQRLWPQSSHAGQARLRAGQRRRAREPVGDASHRRVAALRRHAARR
mmetsp:Transcript_19475/g.56094  ORF Transcript_19475/g.56094 Transcript_19475/m.56094 type:complete len:457 (+) Transcript_19475:244-1614(+)